VSNAIDTSTTAWATEWGYVRKIAFINGKFWAFYANGTAIEYSYSADGTTWASGGTTTGNECFSIWPDVANNTVYITRKAGNTQYVRKGTVGATSISWGDEYSFSDEGEESFFWGVIVRDTAGYLWIFYTYSNRDLYPFLRVRRSTNVDDVSSWGDYTELGGGEAEDILPFTAVPLTSGKVYVIWWDSAAQIAKGRLYDGSWGDPVTIVDIGTYISEWDFGPAVASGDEVYWLLSHVGVVFYKYSSGSWGAGVSLASGTNPKSPTISLDEANTELYALWLDSNVVKYRKGLSPFAALNWESVVVLEAADTKVRDYLGSGGKDFSSEEIFCFWTEGTGSPYDVPFSSISAPAPEEEGFPGLNPALAQVVFG